MKLISNGRRVPFFANPGLSSSDFPWAGYRFVEANGPAEPLPSHSWPKTTLLYVTGGSASVHWKHRGIWHTDSMRYGTVSIIRRDVEIQSAVPSNAVPTMVLELDNSKLQHVAPDDSLAIDQSLETAQVTNDGRLAALMSAMCMEVRDGCPSGRLYGESLSIALLKYIAARYATPGTLRRESSLSPRQRRIIYDYVLANLADDISVSELAATLSMSPSHFTRVFKVTFGMTPYRFVMQQRIEGAKGMLKEAKLSANDVSAALGFASQSHFAKVFRQFTGVTPKRYRAGF
jgi:AraC family transcriptional regulator